MKAKQKNKAGLEHYGIEALKFLFENYTREVLKTLKELTIKDEPLLKYPSIEVWYCFKNVEQLDLRNTKLAQCADLFEKIVESMPGIKLLNISQNRILHPEDLAPLGKLKQLDNLDFRENPLQKQLTRTALIEVLLFPEKQCVATQHKKVLVATYEHVSARAEYSQVKVKSNAKKSRNLLTELKLVRQLVNPARIPRSGPFPVLRILNEEMITEKEIQDANLYNIDTSVSQEQQRQFSLPRPDVFIKGNFVKSRNWKRQLYDLRQRYPSWKIHKNNKSHHPCNHKQPKCDSMPIYPVNSIVIPVGNFQIKEVREKGLLQILQETDAKSDIDEEEINRHIQEFQQNLCENALALQSSQEKKKSKEQVKTSESATPEKTPQETVQSSEEDETEEESATLQAKQEDQVKEKQQTNDAVLRILKGDFEDEQSTYKQYQNAPIMEWKRQNKKSSQEIFQLVNEQQDILSKNIAMQKAQQPAKQSVVQNLAQSSVSQHSNIPTTLQQTKIHQPKLLKPVISQKPPIDLIPNEQEGTTLQWRIEFQEKEAKKLRRLTNRLAYSRNLLDAIKRDYTSETEFLDMANQFEQFNFSRLMEILNNNFGKYDYTNYKEIKTLIRLINNYPQILGEKMEAYKINVLLQESMGKIDQEDLEIYNEFLDIQTELDSFPPKGQQALRWWLSMIEQQELKAAEHRAILAMHKQRVFGKAKHYQAKPPSHWADQYLYQPKIVTKSGPGMQFLHSVPKSKPALAVFNMVQGQDLSEDNIVLRTKQLLEQKKNQPYGRLSSIQHQFKGSMLEQFPTINEVQNKEKPWLKPMLHFEEIMSQLDQQMHQKELEFQKLSYEQKLQKQVEQMKKNIEERQNFRGKIETAIKEVRMQVKDFMKEQGEFLKEYFDDRLLFDQYCDEIETKPYPTGSKYNINFKPSE